MVNKLLSNILVDMGIITIEQCNIALKTQAQTGGLLGIILLDSKVITEQQLYAALEYQNSIKDC